MLRGSCLCNGVQFEIRGEPRPIYYCHCSMCRKATGSSFATNMLVAKDLFHIASGHALLKGFESSPGEHRYFCSGCGSPIYGEALARKGVVSVRCGSLRDDPVVRPVAHYFADSRAPWVEIRDGLPLVPEERPGAETFGDQAR
jgi:hypothetical protein